MTDLTAFPDGLISLRVSEERVEHVSADLEAILAAGFLKPALAGKLFG